MSTRLVPWSFSIPLRRYSSTMAMPPRGRKYKIQGCSPRSSAPQSMPRWKAAATAPTSRPVAPEYSSHLQKRSPSRKTLRTWFWSSVMVLSPLPHRRVWVDYTTVEGKCLWEMGFLWEFLQGDFAVCGRRVTLPAAAHRRKVRSTPFPPGGENCARSLAPPLPGEPTSLGFAGRYGAAGDAADGLRLRFASPRSIGLPPYPLWPFGPSPPDRGSRPRTPLRGLSLEADKIFPARKI